MPDASSELRAGLLRLFVAIELSGEVREALSRLQHELQRRGLEKLRWVRPEGMHLTLKFLGETPAEKVPAIEEGLARAAAPVKPDQVTLGGLGMFGSRRSPRVLWIGVQSVPSVFDLYTRIEGELSGQGFLAEERPFAPHLTLARVGPEVALEVRPAMVEAIHAVEAPHSVIPAREVSLMRSRLRPSGAVYERVAVFALRGAAWVVVGGQRNVIRNRGVGAGRPRIRHDRSVKHRHFPCGISSRLRGRFAPTVAVERRLNCGPRVRYAA